MIYKELSDFHPMRRQVAMRPVMMSVPFLAW
jgi:hypothetical protein